VSAIRLATSSALVVAIAGCGGGGSDSAERITRTPLPQVVQDSLPAGVRIDVSSDQFFTVAAGDDAIYTSTDRDGQSVRVRRAVIQGPDASNSFVVEESVPTQAGLGSDIERWQLRADGLYALDYFGDGAPPGFKALVGDTLLYPTPFYPAGSVRTLVRQGSLGADIDGDTFPESFRFELQQTFVGFESGTRGGRVERRARFNNRILITIEPSRPDLAPLRSESTEDVLFATHTGLISNRRTLVINSSNEASHQGPVALVAGTLAGRSIETAWNGGTVRYFAMKHHDLAYDPVSGYYYAGLSATDASHPSTVARIDPVSASMVFSTPLGNDVRSIALSSDGRSLYAGVYNQAEIVELSVPDLQIVRRIPIQAGTWAFGLAASPTDSAVFAYYGDNGGNLRLVRNGVVQPRGPGFFDARVDSTTDPTMFTPDGTALLLFGTTGGSGSGLMGVGVLPDGFNSQAQPVVGGTAGRSLSTSSAGIVAGASLFRANDLAFLGAAPANLNLDSCRALRDTTRWACKTFSNTGLRIGVLDAPSMTLVEDGYVPLGLAPQGTNPTSMVRLVPGPRGQVAVMMGGEAFWYGDWVVLFDNPDFR